MRALKQHICKAETTARQQPTAQSISQCGVLCPAASVAVLALLQHEPRAPKTPQNTTATAGVSGRLWGTFLPAEEPTSDTEAPRGVSILARDMQSVAIYDARGQFVGIRRPDSGRPIEVRWPLYIPVTLSLAGGAFHVVEACNRSAKWQRRSVAPDCSAESVNGSACLGIVQDIRSQCVTAGSLCCQYDIWYLISGWHFTMQVEGMELVIEDMVGATGLELKSDPGVPFVYAGFAGMMVRL